MQRDGKLVAAGDSGKAPQGVFTLVRYLANGSLDSSFGAGGKVAKPVGTALDLVVQKDGKLVAVGDFEGADFQFALALVRYNVDGSFDRSFGEGGKVTLPRRSSGETVVLQGDGKLVVAGGDNDNGFLIARYNANGTLDQRFGSGGVVTTPIGSTSSSSSVVGLVIQADGKLVALGDSERDGWTLVRYKPNGALDRSFGSHGEVTTTIGPRHLFADALVMRDGKLIAEGHLADHAMIALARYNANGSLDRSFGSGGKVTTSIGSAGEGSTGALVIQKDGKLVAAGGSANPGFTLVRYDANGSIDRSFGSRGRVTTPIGDAAGSSNSFSFALLARRDGKLVVAGSSAKGPPVFALARYLR